jgi:hypothetical protein
VALWGDIFRKLFFLTAVSIRSQIKKSLGKKPKGGRSDPIWEIRSKDRVTIRSQAMFVEVQVVVEVQV